MNATIQFLGYFSKCLNPGPFLTASTSLKTLEISLALAGMHLATEICKSLTEIPRSSPETLITESLRLF